MIQTVPLSETFPSFSALKRNTSDILKPSSYSGGWLFSGSVEIQWGEGIVSNQKPWSLEYLPAGTPASAQVCVIFCAETMCTHAITGRKCSKRGLWLRASASTKVKRMPIIRDALAQNGRYSMFQVQVRPQYYLKPDANARNKCYDTFCVKVRPRIKGWHGPSYLLPPDKWRLTIRLMPHIVFRQTLGA